MSGTAPTQRYIPSLRVWLSLTSLLLILALGASLSISLQHFAGAALEREVGERVLPPSSLGPAHPGFV